jgi:putative NADH-flavin reductase
MNLVVVGATGRTGQIPVQKALAAGHHVTVAARRPEAAQDQGERLRRIRGDLFGALAVSSLRVLRLTSFGEKKKKPFTGSTRSSSVRA